ncbi:hypothetical protein ACM41_14240 [Bradyrhizobium sp. CCBAU 21362]|nr:hypothetical protein [Bradyrhizobium sp. CCBAU 21362]
MIIECLDRFLDQNYAASFREKLILTVASEPAVFERNSVLLTRPRYRALRAISSTPVEFLFSRMIELRGIGREFFIQPIILPAQLNGDLLDKVRIEVAQDSAQRLS